ncbi:MAG: glycosyltransferase family 39 protein [Anaerolineales bacterium]|nr:glycosyltransferase family 39 protein [Anaerolineales bacterium]
MPSLLIITAYLLIALAFIGQGWRRALLYTALICGTLIAASTEILSLFHAISFWTIAGLWGLTILAALAYLIRNRKNIRFTPSLAPASALTVDAWLLFASVIFIAGMTAVIAFYAAPNTWDSMTYHLARTIHWMQNGSVDFYPTNILRQLHLNPWSEYAMMQFLLLSGSDKLVNFVQWFSMAGSLIGVTLIAEQLGATPRTQVYAAAIAATIPMGILQASSTQNDYAAAFWLVCFVYVGFAFKRSGTMKDALAAGVALGIAILTKATVYIFAIPFLLWFSLSVLWKDRLSAIRPLFAIALIVLLLNSGLYIRNYDLYGSPLGPRQESETGHEYSNNIFTVPALASNMIRNFGMNLGTPDYRINIKLDRFFYKIHEWIGISPNDPRTTWTGVEFHIGYTSYYDGKAGSPLHVWMILLVTPIFLSQKRNKGDEPYYLICLLAGFLIFCLYLRWQSWHARLLLPLVVLWSPFIAQILTQFRARWLISISMLALVSASMIWVFYNESHRLSGNGNIFETDRAQQYMNRNKSLYRPFIETVDLLNRKSCSNIGLVTDADGWEYPLWVMLKKDLPDVHIEHINVENVSSRFSEDPPYNQFEPCAIVMINPTPPNEVVMRDNLFMLTQTEGVVSVFMKQP